MAGVPLSDWKIFPLNDGSSKAVHSRGVEILLSKSGFATVLYCPEDVSEEEAKRLMLETMEWITADVRH